MADAQDFNSASKSVLVIDKNDLNLVPNDEFDGQGSILEPPNSKIAEQCVLAALLFDNDNIVWPLVSHLEKGDFYIPRHGIIFSAMASLIDQEQPVDIITTLEVLEKLDKLKSVGGLEYLKDLLKSNPTKINAKSYGDLIKEKSLRRQIIRLGRDISDSALIAKTQSLTEIFNESDRAIGILRDKYITGDNQKLVKFYFGENMGNTKQINWLIEDYLMANSVAVMFGPSGHGKSFLALDFMLHIAAGIPWHGRETQQGATLYICGEGRERIIPRIRVWEQYYNQSIDIPFGISDQPVLMLEDNAIHNLMKSIDIAIEEVNQPVKMICIDTLARNFGDGDENSTRDMSKFVNAVDDLRIRTGACTMIIHHTGVIDSTRARGNGALKAGADSEFIVEKSDNDIITLSQTKQKDRPKIPPISFLFNTISVYADDGEPIDSSVLSIDKDAANSSKDEKESNLSGKMPTANQKVACGMVLKLAGEILRNNPNIGPILIARVTFIDLMKESISAKSSRVSVVKYLFKTGLLIDHNSHHYEVNRNEYNELTHY